jgi:hypothetical protein
VFWKGRSVGYGFMKGRRRNTYVCVVSIEMIGEGFRARICLYEIDEVRYLETSKSSVSYVCLGIVDEIHRGVIMIRKVLLCSYIIGYVFFVVTLDAR